VDERHAWLGFSLIPEIGPRRISYLRQKFSSLVDAWGASERALREAGVKGQPLTNILRMRQKLNPQAELTRVEQAGAHLLTLDDDLYPALLKPLPDAPPVLYIKGALALEDTTAIAIVGTRKATHYGRSAAIEISKHLAANGVCIISGLAPGIDAAAHRAALAANGRTVAVLGCGIDRLYPPEHAELAAQIVKQGALVSEFPLGTPPDGRNFPRRNRIISGMALGVLIVEAPEQSGALITAGIAAEQGRDVFAIPGSIFSLASGGTNKLIQDGAKPVMRADDILNELQIARTRAEAHVRLASALAFPENELETQVMALLSHEPIHIDDLARACKLPVAVISSALTMLELKGLAQNIGHMQYCLNR
jgi:DNA processing protein